MNKSERTDGWTERDVDLMWINPKRAQGKNDIEIVVSSIWLNFEWVYERLRMWLAIFFSRVGWEISDAESWNGSQLVPYQAEFLLMDYINLWIYLIRNFL